jgi:predicted DNA-binding transcriptional regulator YafY
MDQPKIERLLRLMKMLTTNNRYTIDDIAEKLNMSQRTIYRYIDTFREAGFVVKKNGSFIRLDKQSPYFKDISQLVHFTDEEAHILKSAIESIDENNVIKQNLKSKLYSVYDYKILAECVTKGSNAKNVNSIVEAMENRKQIVLKNYKSANSGHISDRIIEPYEFTTNYIQVWGYELESGINKIYKILVLTEFCYCSGNDML